MLDKVAWTTWWEADGDTTVSEDAPWRRQCTRTIAAVGMTHAMKFYKAPITYEAVEGKEWEEGSWCELTPESN